MNKREVQKIEHVNGGAGFILKEVLINPEQMGQYCHLFAQVTLEPGCEIGFHYHHNETETYYLLSGQGIYRDNDQKIEVKAGDVTFCKEGHGHGLINTGTEKLTIIALILKA